MQTRTGLQASAVLRFDSGSPPLRESLNDPIQLLGVNRLALPIKPTTLQLSQFVDANDDIERIERIDMLHATKLQKLIVQIKLSDSGNSNPLLISKAVADPKNSVYPSRLWRSRASQYFTPFSVCWAFPSNESVSKRI